jgi:hypothetical protein
LAKIKSLEKEILSSFLPLGMLDHFTIKEIEVLGDVKLKKDYFTIHLEEKNKILSKDVDENQYESKGFTEITLQDFPLRGKAVYLKIRRRRWRNKQDSKDIIRNDFTYVAEGSVFTKELADFLKGGSRYQRRYNK